MSSLLDASASNSLWLLLELEILMPIVLAIVVLGCCGACCATTRALGRQKGPE